MNIVLINPRYPFGKDQIFLGGSLVAVAARLMSLKFTVHLVDLNIDRLNDASVQTKIAEADMVGISLSGAPYIPSVIDLITELRGITQIAILLGGQIIERTPPEQFTRIFPGNVVQIRSDNDLTRVLGVMPNDLPDAYDLSFRPVWKELGEERLTEYLRHESALVISQGCKYHCVFCAATKGVPESFRTITYFEADLCYLADVAKRHNITQLEFYATSLDFFQNPETVREYLEAAVRVQNDYDITLRIRCLARFDSFLQANARIPDLGKLLNRAGLWCIGFGADGADPSIWRSQAKLNIVTDIPTALALCQTYSVRAELLMVFGFPEDTLRTLSKSVAACFLSVIRWSNVIVRPYLAKTVVPGNVGWKKQPQIVERIVTNTNKCYNLDFCTIGSPLTHPRRFHRWICNAAYLLICGVLTPIGKCTTSPLLPQGEAGLYGRLARAFNRLMPFDR